MVREGHETHLAGFLEPRTRLSRTTSEKEVAKSCDLSADADASALADTGMKSNNTLLNSTLCELVGCTQRERSAKPTDEAIMNGASNGSADAVEIAKPITP